MSGGREHAGTEGECRMEATIYTEAIPVAEVRGGMVFITIDGGDHPRVCSPIYAVREFCEVTILALNEWEAEQAGRSVVAPLRRKGAT